MRGECRVLGDHPMTAAAQDYKKSWRSTEKMSMRWPAKQY